MGVRLINPGFQGSVLQTFSLHWVNGEVAHWQNSLLLSLLTLLLSTFGKRTTSIV